jgi:hypothetical protein
MRRFFSFHPWPAKHRCERLFSFLVNHDAPRKTTASSKARAPSPPTVRFGNNRLETPCVSQLVDTVAINPSQPSVSSINDTVRSTISTGSFDYLRGPRRCALQVDRNKGLGFVLSATGDYDHTITAVEKVSSFTTLRYSHWSPRLLLFSVLSS